MNTSMAISINTNEKKEVHMDTVFSIIDSNGKIGFIEDICADGICCFMSVPGNQAHLGLWKHFVKKGNASYGIKLLYSRLQSKDIVYSPCKCLDFYLREFHMPDGHALRVVLRCGIFKKWYRPYTCRGFPDKADSFMHDILAPCIYNEYIAPENYMALKHKEVFKLYYAIKDDIMMLKKISPGYTPEEIRDLLQVSASVKKVCTIWDGKPSEYFLIAVPKAGSVLYTSDKHPRIESIGQAYNLWQGHIEEWLERHYGERWQEHIERAIKQEQKGKNKKLKRR